MKKTNTIKIFIIIFLLFPIFFSFNISATETTTSFSIISTGKSIYVSNADWNTAMSASSGTLYNNWLQDHTSKLASYTIYRGYMLFDTSSLPDAGYHITKVNLSINMNYLGIVPAGNYHTHYIQYGNFGNTITTSDYDYTLFGNLFGSVYLNSTGVYNISTTNTDYVSLTSITGLVLRTSYDYNNSAPPQDYNTGAGTNSFTTIKLWVTYEQSPPTVNITNINCNSSYTTWFNETSNLWEVNITSTGYNTSLTIINNTINTTGKYESYYNSSTGWTIYLNFTGSGGIINGTGEYNLTILLQSLEGMNFTVNWTGDYTGTGTNITVPVNRTMNITGTIEVLGMEISLDINQLNIMVLMIMMIFFIITGYSARNNKTSACLLLFAGTLSIMTMLAVASYFGGLWVISSPAFIVVAMIFFKDFYLKITA